MTAQLLHIRVDPPLLEQLDRVAERLGHRQRAELIRRLLWFALREAERDLARGRPARALGTPPKMRGQDTA